MFKNRTFIALVALAGVGGAVAYTQMKKDPHVRKGGKTPNAPIALKAAAIDELTVAEPGKPEVNLKKDGAAWKMVQPVPDTVDEKAVADALKTLEEMKFK